MISVLISQKAEVFKEKIVPEAGKIVGYNAMINHFNLQIPYPRSCSLISIKNIKHTSENWSVYPKSYMPDEKLLSHLVFAIKNEGLNLLFFKKIFEKIPTSEIINWIKNEPNSIYARKIWFLYEFLMRARLPIEDADKKLKYTPLIDESIQFANADSIKSNRHKILNNLLGGVDFCPTIYKSNKIKSYIDQKLDEKCNAILNKVHNDIWLRTSTFLLLKDSKASFTIEGEKPIASRASRWGKVIGEAGKNNLTKGEITRLQQIIIESPKFTKFGYRTEGGFIGEHDRDTSLPLPDHISAKPEDLESLMNGLMNIEQNLDQDNLHPVLISAIVAFGFVFIHPLVDGNGRLHRYIIHHVLRKNKFTPQNSIFPISASILNKINDYRLILEQYSHGILPFIQWEPTLDHNVTVLNETADYYRYFDVTSQAEFLFECINDTIINIIPAEVEYLKKYDEFKSFIDDSYEMPDKLCSVLVIYLNQNNGKLSNNKKESNFSDLSEKDVEKIEKMYAQIFR